MAMNMLSLSDLRRELRDAADPEKAKLLERFFKTGKGEYAEGDRFLGVMVPVQRRIAKRYGHLPLHDITRLLRSPWHEERLIALFLLTSLYRKSDEGGRKTIYEAYLAHTRYINNWDLVDLSAGSIVGGYLLKRSKTPLVRLARSKDLWERRIAILATFASIMEGECGPTLRIAELLLRDRHDLMHKAVGWMLREVGKRCSMEAEERFLKRHYRVMPRTMLRYAIERFPERKRKAYLLGRA